MGSDEKEIEKSVETILNCLENEDSFKLKTLRKLSKYFHIELVKERLNLHHSPTFE